MKTYLKIVAFILVAYLLIYFGINLLGNWNNYDEHSLEDYITVEITKKDGSVLEPYNSYKFPVMDRGDYAVITFDLPNEYYVEEPAICFRTYNCVLKLSYNGEVLYTYGEDLHAKQRHIGSVYSTVPFPEEAFGSQLVLECYATENEAMSQIVDMRVVPAVDAGKVILADHLPEFIIFMSIMLVSFALLITLFIFRSEGDYFRITLWSTLFAFLGSGYTLSNYGLINAFVNHYPLLGDLEYLFLFALPIPFSGYFFEIFKDQRGKKLQGIMTSGYAILFVVATILNYTTEKLHFSSILTYFLVIILFCLISCCVTLYWNLRGGRWEEWTQVLLIGAVIFCAVAFFDVIRFNLNLFAGTFIAMFDRTTLPVGLVILIASFMISGVMYINKTYEIKKEKEQLAKIAYVDALTGLDNRARYNSFIEEMKAGNVKEYTFFYMDLNNLKKINDEFGHNYGDQYLKTSAEIMQKCFSNADLISRIGGDEFMVIYNRKLRKNEMGLIEQLAERYKGLNNTEAFFYELNVACGMVSSTKDKPLDIDEAINLADKRMYENKAEIKK